MDQDVSDEFSLPLLYLFYLFFRPYQMLVIDSKKRNPEQARFWPSELLRYQGKLDLLAELQKWEIPKFPINGDDIKREGVPGRFFLVSKGQL